MVKSHDNKDVLKRVIFIKSTLLHSRLFHTITIFFHVYVYLIANSLKTICSRDHEFCYFLSV